MTTHSVALTRLSASDCLACGACCAPIKDQDIFCDIVPRDEKRLGARLARRLVRVSSPFDMVVAAIGGRSLPWAAIKTKLIKQTLGPLRGTTICVCAALRGNLMHRVHCSIYKVRPGICRTACRPGSKGCMWARDRLQHFIHYTETA